MGNIVELKQHINKETGEKFAESQRELPDYFNPDNGYKMMARTKNIRMFPNVPFPKELSRTDMGHLLFLSRHIWANTGVLGKVIRRSFKPYDDDELINCVGFTNNRRGAEWLSRMVNLSMLRSIDVNLPDDKQERQWYMNPIYFCPMFITRQAYLIWRDQVQKHIPSYVKSMFN
jgi:hypothetical protein